MYKSTHLLSYDYHTLNLGKDFGFNYKIWGLYNKKNITINSSLLSIGK